MVGLRSEMSECKSQWRELWGGTTTNPMWDMLSQVVSKHARAVLLHEGHSNALYLQFHVGRNALIQQRFMMSGAVYDLEQRQRVSQGPVEPTLGEGALYSDEHILVSTVVNSFPELPYLQNPQSNFV